MISIKISRQNSEETYQKTPTYLSTWIASGALDPLTRLGKDAQLIYHNYKTLGMSITLKIYDNKRHALLFGKDRINVYTDISCLVKRTCLYLTFLRKGSFFSLMIG